jgi:hypothetical protein
MPSIKVKTSSGHITEMQIEELLEIDGKAFRQADETEYLSIQIAKLDGRLTTVERAIFPPVENEREPNG